MKNERKEFVYLIEPLDTGWAAYKATYGKLGEFQRELLAVFPNESAAEALIRDLVDKNQKHKRMEERATLERKRKEAKKLAVLVDNGKPDDKVLVSQSEEVNDNNIFFPPVKERIEQ